MLSTHSNLLIKLVLGYAGGELLSLCVILLTSLFALQNVSCYHYCHNFELSSWSPLACSL